ncbi:SDR family NAD(P)-dependent oxidoreductase [Tundrisphaera sp. TA3]|uniref:SDR family NAD(P)-dependent oxidoreductase n=1 Tax=Tundrisphaera sp. TA3 TaxID=3435775 RepID=UPI003EB6A357
MGVSRRRTFRGARCLVTGASSGLGRALAEHLAHSGARVLLTGRSTERLEAIVASLVASGIPADSVPTVAADLTEASGRDRVIAKAGECFGALDLAINGAGVGATGHFDTHDPSVFRTVFEINVFALVEMTRAMLPLLRRGESPSLVNIGSIVARRGLPGRSEYTASKFAVAGFTEAIRAEWVKFGIDVMLLNPGFTATEFEQNLVVDTAKVSVTHKRVMTADQVARSTLRAVLRRRKELTLTAEGRMLLLVNRLAPRIVDAGLARFTRRVFGVSVSAPD